MTRQYRQTNRPIYLFSALTPDEDFLIIFRIAEGAETGARSMGDRMSTAAIRESNVVPRMWRTFEMAEASAAVYRMVDGDEWKFEVRPRNGGGFYVARLNKLGEFDSWIAQ